MLKNFDDLLERVQGFKEPRVCAVVAADGHAIEAALQAEEKNLAKPYFIGCAKTIGETLEKLGKNPVAYQIDNAETDEQAAKIAVLAAREGKADMLMKGHIATRTLLKAVVDKEEGLGTGHIMTHLGALDLGASYHKVLFATDGGMVHPQDVDKKHRMIEACVTALHALGYEEPKVACLTAVEVVNPKMEETVDAAELKARNERGDIKGCLVEGPISFDLAFSKEAADIKDYTSPVAGDADLLVYPTLAACNIATKAMNYAAQAPFIGLVIGAKVPIILTSRSSAAREKYLSVALSALISEGGSV